MGVQPTREELWPNGRDVYGGPPPVIGRIVDVRAVGNIGQGEDTLFSFTLPAGLLKNDGDQLELIAAVQYAANTRNKTSKLKFGSTVIAGRGPAADNGSQIFMRALITRTAVGAQLSRGLTAVSTTATQLVTSATPAANLAGPVIVSVTGESPDGGAQDNDLVGRLFVVQYLPVAQYFAS